MIVTKFWTAAALCAFAAGCTLTDASMPPLAGPSESALSLSVSAKPDLIPQDGIAAAFVEIVARDAHAQPVRALVLDLATFVNGVRMDYGSISSRRISTDRDGRALVTYYPPPAQPNANDDVTVAVVVTPVGTNFAEERERVVLIRLVRPGVVLPPNRPPTAEFFFSPASPRENDAVIFDASRSTDDGQVVSFVWSFGDGGSGSGVRTTHRFQSAGTYNVVLTITDDRGGVSVSAPTPVVVTTSADPVAAFTMSPAEPVIGQAVILNATASRASPGRNLTSFVWDFGDGSPPGAGVTTTHAFAAAGSYTVVLNVTDSVGRKGTSSQTISIKVAAR